MFLWECLHTLYYEQTESASESEETIHEVYDVDDDYLNVEPIDNENGENKEDQDVIGAANNISEVPSDEPVLKTNIWRENLSIHSRESEEEEKEKGNEEYDRNKKKV